MRPVTQHDEFTLFPKLPPELRVKGWCYAAQHGRIIEIRTRRIRGCPKKFWTDSVSPSVFSACLYSRSEALKFYSLLECKNPCYHADDGTDSDAREAGENYMWESFDYNTYIPPPDDDESNQTPRHITNSDKVPTFRVYLGLNDIVYLDPRHNINFTAFECTLTTIAWESRIIPRIAFSTKVFVDDVEHNTYMHQFIDFICYSKSSLITLVRRDVCCRGGSNTRKL
jgi:2EXR family